MIYQRYIFANNLANTDGIPKLDLYHPANTLTNIDEKTNNFIRKEIFLYQIDSSLFITR